MILSFFVFTFDTCMTLTSDITPQSDTEATCASRPLVSVSVIGLQQNQPDCLSGDSQTYNKPSDEALICRKTPPTCPAEWFLGPINHHSKYHPEWFSAQQSYKSSGCFATVCPSFITLATLHLECLDVVPVIRNWFWTDLLKIYIQLFQQKELFFQPSP